MSRRKEPPIDPDVAKARHNLSDVIEPFTKLKSRGPREMVGLCPFHEERSPSFEVNDAKGLYHCWGCNASGDHITFLMVKAGMTYKQALEALSGDRFPVVSEEERARRKEADARAIAARIEWARSIWASTVPLRGTVGMRYVRARGITVPLPETVRFALTPRWFDHETGETSRPIPAVVCALQNATGDVSGVQCIFLKPDGRGKYERIGRDGKRAKAKLTFGTVIGAALRLGPDSEHVTICEGPEDSWTLFQEMPGSTVWASCGTANLSQIIFPDFVRSVTIAGDNGAAGHAAVATSRTAYLARGLGVNENFPSAPFKDWNDQMLRKTIC